MAEAPPAGVRAGDERDRPELLVVRLGVVEYRAAVALQEAVRERRIADELPDLLLLVEHPPVYTQGRRSRPEDLPFAPEWYAEQGIDVVPVRRGGQLTYHGPGQLVGYPIMRIDDVIAYLRTMEEALIAALGDEGLTARNRPDEGIEYTGVWVQERKLASIGVHVQRHVTTHGFAVNVDNDMRPFEWAVACGLHGVQMTSLADERGEAAELTRPSASEPLAPAREPSPTLTQLADHVVTRFAQAFERDPVEAMPDALGIALPGAQIAS
ncbi:MAG TPA: lipoyl(octanoyl) transferase LipB [Conexibacter sp.]|nr:lipoyl(octanoyl) transferase LipB [Conexibacter sp.]